MYRMLNLSKKHNYIFTYFPYDEYRRLSHFTRHLSTEIDKNPFLAPIPIRYIRSKDKPFTIQFNIEELYRHSFINIVKTIPKDVAYTVFTKVRYNVDSYFMAGNQFGFMYENENNLDDLYHILSEKLEIYLSSYDLSEDNIEYVELVFRKFDKQILTEFKRDDFKTKLLSEDKDRFIAKSEIFKFNNMLSIPISISEDSLGKALEVEIDDNKIIQIQVEKKILRNKTI